MEDTLQPAPADLWKRGYSLIPCNRKKRPLLTGWKAYQSRRPTAEQVDQWSKKRTTKCWAVLTGEISGLVVLDFDGKQGKALLERLGLAPHVRTGSGGSHVYFRHPGWRVPTVNAKSKRELGRLYAGLDIRADGGYAICLGSSEKGEYRWLRNSQPDPLDILPPDLREFLGLAHPPAQTPGQSLTALGVPPGPPRGDASARIEKALRDALDEGRNIAGFRLACWFRDNGYSQGEASELGLEYVSRVHTTNQHAEHERYTRQEWLASVREAYKRPPRAAATEAGVANNSNPAPETSQPPRTARPQGEKVPQLPDGAWHPVVREYLNVVNRGSETPPSFHLAGFLVAVGVALGRSIWLDHFRKLYPSIWCVLLGRSARAHKDHAMQPASKLARLLAPDLPIRTSVDSREGLIDDWQKLQKDIGKTEPFRALINLTEVRLLVDKANREGGRNIIPTMAELYNYPDTIENNSKGAKGAVYQPSVCFVAGTTMSWLSKLRPDDIEGGLGNRLMWVTGERGPLQSRATQFDSEGWDKLVAKLGGVLKYWHERANHEIKLAPDATDCWDELYREKYGPDLPDELVSTLAARAQEHCLKTAMIYAALDMADHITCEHLARAALWTNFLIEVLWHLFTDFVESPLVKLDKKIINYVRNQGSLGAERRQVYWACKPVDAVIFNKRIDALVATEELAYNTELPRKRLVHRDLVKARS
jgi:hypothetical protein